LFIFHPPSFPLSLVISVWKNVGLKYAEKKYRSFTVRNAPIVSFRLGAEDARYLSEEFYPAFSRDDLVNLPAYEIYLKLMIDGKTSEPFSGGTLGVG